MHVKIDKLVLKLGWGERCECHPLLLKAGPSPSGAGGSWSIDWDLLSASIRKLKWVNQPNNSPGS